jgi:long-chain acyl-CoA synthetase
MQPSAYDRRPWLSSYPPDVPTSFEFPVVPLTRLLDDSARAFPNAVATAFAGSTLTYRELARQVDRFAGALTGLGIGAGDRVALALPNCPQHVIAFFAVLRIGAIVVQCNPLSVPDELRRQLDDCDPSAVVCLDKNYPAVSALRDSRSFRALVVASLTDYYPLAARQRMRLPTPKARAQRAALTAPVEAGPDVHAFRDLVRHGTPARQVPVDPAVDVAVLQYTGGTTGNARAAMLTHANLVANAYQMRLWLPEATSGREVSLAVLPLFHVYGLTLCLLTTVLLAGRLVLLPRFDLDLVFDAIDEHRPTLLPGVPPIYQAIVDSPRARRHDLSSIRACVSGAMRLPTEVQERFERVTGGRLVEGYGTTEASPATHCNPVHGQRKPGSIGLPLTGTDARIVDPDDPQVVVPPGQVGELVVRGPQVFRGYWATPTQALSAHHRPAQDQPAEDQPAEHQPLLADGWLLTGDLAVMDEDGYFAIVDRKKDVIIAGGFNIYPAEVEAVLTGHDAVADCCVAGIPDRYRGETVKAFIVPAPGATVDEDELREYCTARLSAYKVPKMVELREELPRTVVGKALRRVLIAEELERRAAEQAPANPVPGGPETPDRTDSPAGSR